MTKTATLRSLAFACAFAAPSFLLHAQTAFLSWADQFGGTGYDYVNNICTDNLGNVYSTGVFRNTVDFDPGSGTTNLVSAGAQDIFVSKVDANGSLVWAVKVGGTGADMGNEIALDANGYVYVAGSFEGTVDFNPGAGTSNLSAQAVNSSFILKLTPQGNFSWAKAIGSNQGNSAEGLSVSAPGVVHVGGNFAGVCDLDPGAGTQSVVTNGNFDMYLVELDSSGSFVWGINFGSNGIDNCSAVAEDVNGDIYMTGFFGSTCDFDPGNGTTNLTASGYDAFVTKYNSSGALQWAAKLGGGGTDGGSDITVDFTGNVYSTGYFDGTADFDPGSGTVNFTAGTGISDAYVSILTTNGAYSWAGELGGSSVDVGHSIALDLTGNIYVTGRFASTGDFDPSAGTSNLTSAGVEDVFITKLTSAGAFVAAHKFGGAANDNGNAIALDPTNNMFIAGYFSGSTDVDPQASTWTLTSAGQDDGYLIKLSQSGVGISESNTTPKILAYPNPASGEVLLQMPVVFDELHISIYSSTGQVVKTQFCNTTAGPVAVDLSGLEAGLYMIEVLNGEEAMFTEVLVQ